MIRFFKWIEETSEKIRNSTRIEENKSYNSRGCASNRKRYKRNDTFKKNMDSINRRLDDLEGRIYDNYDE